MASRINIDFLSNAEWDSIGIRLRLTNRERELLVLAVSGASEEEIAQELGISRNTVHAHMTRMYRKVGVSDRAQLVLRAFQPHVTDAKLGSGSSTTSTDAISRGD